MASGCNLEYGTHGRSVYFGVTVSGSLPATINEAHTVSFTPSLGLSCLAALGPQANTAAWRAPATGTGPWCNCARSLKMDWQIDSSGPPPRWRLRPYDHNWFGKVVTPPTDYYCYNHNVGDYEVTFPVSFNACPGLSAEIKSTTIVSLERCNGFYQPAAHSSFGNDYVIKVKDPPPQCCYRIQRGTGPFVTVTGAPSMSCRGQCASLVWDEEVEHERQYEQYTDWSRGGVFQCLDWNRVVNYLGGLGVEYCDPVCSMAQYLASSALRDAVNRVIYDWQRVYRGDNACWIEYTAKRAVGWDCAYHYSCTYGGGGGCPDPPTQPPDPCP